MCSNKDKKIHKTSNFIQQNLFQPWSCLETETHLTSSTALVKGLVLAYGLACVMLAFMSQYLGGLLQAGLSIVGIAGGPLLGTFTLGMFLPSANEPVSYNLTIIHRAIAEFQ